MSGVRLLDHWSPPDGPARRSRASRRRFTFEADFFTQDCLSRFLSLSTVAGEGDRISSIAAVLEEEDRLSETQVTRAGRPEQPGREAEPAVGRAPGRRPRRPPARQGGGAAVGATARDRPRVGQPHVAPATAARSSWRSPSTSMRAAACRDRSSTIWSPSCATSSSSHPAHRPGPKERALATVDAARRPSRRRSNCPVEPATRPAPRGGAGPTRVSARSTGSATCGAAANRSGRRCCRRSGTTPSPAPAVDAVRRRLTRAARPAPVR